MISSPLEKHPPSLDYIRSLRDMGAKSIWLGDVHVEFGELSLNPPNTFAVRPATSEDLRNFVKNTPVTTEFDGDVAEEEISIEERKRREQQKHDDILFASAD